MKILNIGSCFAGSVAHCLAVMGGGNAQRVCSVQHTRIDQFIRYYVERERSPLFSIEIDFEVKQPFQIVLDNQCDDVRTGRSLPYGLEEGYLFKPEIAMNNGIDLLLIDTFADLLFRAYRDPISGKMIYTHRDHILRPSSRFTIELPRLSANAIISGYVRLFDYVREFNPTAKAILLNFPINDLRRGELIDRTFEIEKEASRLWKHGGFGVIDLEDIALRDLTKETDPFHFIWPRYFQYSQKVLGLLQMLNSEIEVPHEFRRG